MNQFLINSKIIAEAPISIAIYTQILKHSSVKDKILFSDYTQEQISKEIKVSRKSIYASNYLDLLKRLGFTIKISETADGYLRYSYLINKNPSEYFVITDEYYDMLPELGYKLWSFILKLRACCYNDSTTYSDEQLIKMVNMSKVTFNKYIAQAIELKLIKKNSVGYSIICKGFEYAEHWVIKMLRKYSEAKGATYYHNRDESIIADMIANRVTCAKLNSKTDKDEATLLADALDAKFKNIGSKVNISYYSKVFVDTKARRKNNLKNISQIIL